MFLIVGCHDIILFKREHLTLTITVKHIYIYTHTHTKPHTERWRERESLSYHHVPWQRHLTGPLTKFKTTDTHRERGKKRDNWPKVIVWSSCALIGLLPILRPLTHCPPLT